MIVGIISKEDHAKSHAKGLEEDGHVVHLLGSNGERIPDNLEVLVCRIASCSHHGSSVAREWKRKTGRPLVVEDGLAGIRRKLCEIGAGLTPVAPLAPPKGTQVRPVPVAAPVPVALPPPPPPPPPPASISPLEPNMPPVVPLPAADPKARNTFASFTREDRVGALTKIFRENPGLTGGEAWAMHEKMTSPRTMDRTFIAEARRIAGVGSTTRTSEPEPKAAAPGPTASAATPPWMPRDMTEHILALMTMLEELNLTEISISPTDFRYRRVVIEEGKVTL